MASNDSARGRWIQPVSMRLTQERLSPASVDSARVVIPAASRARRNRRPTAEGTMLDMSSALSRPSRLGKAKTLPTCTGAHAATILPVPDVDEADPVIVGLRYILRVRDMNESELSLKAGRARAHVSNILKGAQGTNLTTEVARSFAWAGQVSLSWFQTGAGSPDGPDVPHRPPGKKKTQRRSARYPSLVEALAQELHRGIAQAAIAEVQKMRPKCDPGREFWTEQLRSAQSRWLQGVLGPRMKSDPAPENTETRRRTRA